MTTLDPKIDQLAINVAATIRDAVAPSLGDPAARERVGIAPGGDVTMAIDEIADGRDEEHTHCRNAQ